MSASQWDVVYNKSLDSSDDGTFDTPLFCKVFLIHILHWPFSPLLGHWFFGGDVVKMMGLNHVNYIIISLAYIYINCAFFTVGCLFFTEIFLTNFLILFRTTAIAVKYAYLNKSELHGLWRQPYNKDKAAEFHKAHNMVSGKIYLYRQV